MSPSSIYHVDADNIPNSSMTNKCIVLDLDQTLIATQDSLSTLKELKILTDPKLMELRKRVYHIIIEDLEAPGIGTKYDYWGVTRPHVEEFLLFCFSYFKVVAVWSAGKRYYVESIVDHLFKDLPQPHIIFTRDDCIMDEDGHIEKPLTKMIKAYPSLKMSLSNTLALDDNVSTFSNNPDNGVLIPAYDPSSSITAFSRDDSSLLQFKYWLLQPEVMESDDVRSFDKSKIFKTTPDKQKRRYK